MLTKAQLQELLKAKNDDEDISALLYSNKELTDGFKKDLIDNKPESNSAKMEKEPVKADSVITMTAAEMLLLMKQMNPVKEEKKEIEYDAEIFIR